MSYCSKCGKQIESGAAYCAGCGAAAGGAESQSSQNTQNTQNTQGSQSNTGGNAFSNMMNTPETECAHDDIEANKVLALLSYINLLFLVPLLAAPNSPYAKFHANQGLVLFIAQMVAGAVVSVVFGFFGGIIGAISGSALILTLVGLVTSLVGGAVGIATLTLAIMGIINATSGKAKELPLIGKYKILK